MALSRALKNYWYIMISVVSLFHFLQAVCGDAERTLEDRQDVMLRVPILGDARWKAAGVAVHPDTGHSGELGVSILDGLEITAKTAATVWVQDDYGESRCRSPAATRLHNFTEEIGRVSSDGHLHDLGRRADGGLTRCCRRSPTSTTTRWTRR